jgi:subtilisin
MRVLITFHPTAGVSAQAVETLVSAAGGTVIQQCTFAPIVCADIPKDMIASLQTSSLIKAIESCNYGDIVIQEFRPVEVSIATPTKIASLRIPWGVSKVRAPELHVNGVTGNGIKIGIIDTGGDYTHPDLVASYAGGWDFVNNDADPMDDHGHGTHIWGTIAASLTGGILGIAPGAKVYIYKVLNALGSGSFDSVVLAYQRALDDGCQVTNNSYGAATGSVALETAIKAIADAGVIMMCAAGNSGAGVDTVGFPAKYPEAIAVGATSQTDLIAGFSSRGTKVEISAPGVSIESTAPGGLYKIMSGTSMATPHTVGVVALALGAGVPSAEIRQRMQLAVDLGIPGRDNDYGFGLIDGVAFVNNIPPPPLTKATVLLDGSKSTDADGQIIDYSWSLGDGTTAKGTSTVKKYSTPGLKTIALTVTDNNGAIGTKVRQINIATNVKPVPAISVTYDPPSKLIPCIVTFDSTKSVDPDGVIASRMWKFNDGSIVSGAIVSHNYLVGGSFVATLTLTDDVGGITDGQVTVGPFRLNHLPTAVATIQPLAGPAPLMVFCDATGSKDIDGTIVSYDWNFSGLSKANGMSSQFVFNDPGTYNITLMVTDNDGGTTSRDTVIVVSGAISNSAPIADFTANGA